VGAWLQNELERYQVPGSDREAKLVRRAHPESLYPVFRDEEEMRAGVELGELIAEELRAQ
jgi:hypothetical protein